MSESLPSPQIQTFKIPAGSEGNHGPQFPCTLSLELAPYINNNDYESLSKELNAVVSKKYPGTAKAVILPVTLVMIPFLGWVAGIALLVHYTSKRGKIVRLLNDWLELNANPDWIRRGVRWSCVYEPLLSSAGCHSRDQGRHGSRSQYPIIPNWFLVVEVNVSSSARHH